MTTQHDNIRKASLFTMNGLVDPRVMPGYKPTPTVRVSFHAVIKALQHWIGKAERHHASV